MTRRIVLALTAVAVIGTGAGVASASTSHQSAHGVKAAQPEHQLCLLLYRSDPSNPQHICVNW